MIIEQEGVRCDQCGSAVVPGDSERLVDLMEDWLVVAVPNRPALHFCGPGCLVEAFLDTLAPEAE